MEEYKKLIEAALDIYSIESGNGSSVCFHESGHVTTVMGGAESRFVTVEEAARDTIKELNWVMGNK